MALKKELVNPKLVQESEKNPPANPAPTKADIAYLKGLKARGYVDNEIIEIARKCGFMISKDDIKIHTRKKAIKV